MSGEVMSQQDEDNPRPRQRGQLSRDLINEYFDALQDAIIRGDVPAEATPEIGAFTIMLRSMVHRGRAAEPAVRKLTQELARLDADAPPPRALLDSDCSASRPEDMLLHTLDQILAGADVDGINSIARVSDALTDDEVRAAARGMWHPRVREPGANA
jgi:hypothetical protein